MQSKRKLSECHTKFLKIVWKNIIINDNKYLLKTISCNKKKQRVFFFFKQIVLWMGYINARWKAEKKNKNNHSRTHKILYIISYIKMHLSHILWTHVMQLTPKNFIHFWRLSFFEVRKDLMLVLWAIAKVTGLKTMHKDETVKKCVSWMSYTIFNNRLCTQVASYQVVHQFCFEIV